MKIKKKLKALKKKVEEAVSAPLVKLDLGCGKNKREGFTGVDRIAFEGVDIVADLTQRWPWEDNSVDEAHSSHNVEHYTARERVHFVNELYRVLKPGATCQVIAPHWASCRAYGDPTHQWPPVSEFWFFYLLKAWRDVNAPHTDISVNPDGFSCDFDVTYGYSLRGDIVVRSQEQQQFAMGNYKEVCQDIIATFKAKK